MEDNGRELDPDQVSPPPVKDGHQSSNKELTVMLIGSVGKMRSFKISRKFIWFLSVFFSLYIIISLLLFYLYFNLYVAHAARSDRLKNLEIELSDKTEILKKNKLYIKSLEDFYNAAHKGIDESADAGITGKKTPEPRIPEVSVPDAKKTERTVPKKIEEKTDDGTIRNETPETETSGEAENQDAIPKGAVDDSMEIKDIQFKRTDSDLTLDFKLTNMRAEQKAAEGFIHIIVMDKDRQCPPEWNSAYNKLSDGVPVDFKHGQEFLIQRFRPYQRQYKPDPDSELPSFIRIIVYDRSGQQILEKEFSVTDESANDQS